MGLLLTEKEDPMRHVPLLLAVLSTACASADSQLTKEVEEPGDVAVASVDSQPLTDQVFPPRPADAVFSPGMTPVREFKWVGFRPFPMITLTFREDLPVHVGPERRIEVFRLQLSFGSTTAHVEAPQ